MHIICNIHMFYEGQYWTKITIISSQIWFKEFGVIFIWDPVYNVLGGIKKIGRTLTCQVIRDRY